MKTVLSAILFIILFQLNAQDSIFGEKQLLLETQANSWHELLIPEDFNNDSNIDFIAEIDYDLFMFYSSETNEFSNELLSEFPGDYIDYFDIDLDGDKDIMMEEVYYFKNDGSNNFERDELELNTLWNEFKGEHLIQNNRWEVELHTSLSLKRINNRNNKNSISREKQWNLKSELAQKLSNGVEISTYLQYTRHKSKKDRPDFSEVFGGLALSFDYL